MKTLFVTDLDGTRMRDDKTISQKTTAILNRLIAQGIYFTYATARSFTSASHITKNLDLRLPVIIRNGTVLADPRTREEIEVALFMEKELMEIRQILMNIKIPGFATTYLSGREQKVYLADRMNEGFHAYLQAHADDPCLRMAGQEEELYMGKVCYFTFISA